jgi:hypothetical protein
MIQIFVFTKRRQHQTVKTPMANLPLNCPTSAAPLASLRTDGETPSIAANVMACSESTDESVTRLAHVLDFQAIA